jgi:hypothetical protein
MQLQGSCVTTWVVSGDYDLKISGTCVPQEKNQARGKNVVKFIESEGKPPQEKAAVGPGQLG